ncbi:hypothetical protein Q7P37_001252 [Cladosporium fusiforme]
MPRPNPPPTPGSSSDIRAKEGPHDAPSFVLPPTAFAEADRASNSSSTPSNNGSDSSYRPISPGTSTNDTRKRQSQPHMTVITKDDFSLPPPPTRSRKIIQMKPRDVEQESAQSTNASSKKSNDTSQSTGGKKNAGKSNTAAGRKIARKTAHSLIERRRRSKMNQEFGVLKDMIPACQGQDMHKLAILQVSSLAFTCIDRITNKRIQAGIDYLRYLEQCVSDLQAQNNSPRPPPPLTRAPVDEGLDSDDEMDESHDPEPQPPTRSTTATTTTSYEPTAPLQKSNSIISLPSLSQITTNSPSVFSGTTGRHYSVSSTSQASYSPYIHSNQASPAFGPQLNHIPHYNAPGFGLGSPALQPLDSGSHSHYLRQVAEGAADQLSSDREKSRAATPRQGARSELELDQEATAALLMLNSDRRQWRGTGIGKAGDDRRGSGGGGMSVRDLLSG